VLFGGSSIEAVFASEKTFDLFLACDVRLISCSQVQGSVSLSMVASGTAAHFTSHCRHLTAHGGLKKSKRIGCETVVTT
jgi:hypothetical protein